MFCILSTLIEKNTIGMIAVLTGYNGNVLLAMFLEFDEGEFWRKVESGKSYFLLHNYSSEVSTTLGKLL